MLMNSSNFKNIGKDQILENLIQKKFKKTFANMM